MTSTGRVHGLRRARSRHLLGTRLTRPHRGGLRPEPARDLVAEADEQAADAGVPMIERNVPARGLCDRALARNVPLEDMEVGAPHPCDLVLGHVAGVLLARYQRVLPMGERADQAQEI